MKKMLVALGLLAAVAVAAWAQTSGTNTVSQGGYYFNAKTGNRTTADGDVRVYQSNAPDFTFSRYQAIINDTTLVGSADSSAFYQTSGFRRSFLKIKWTASSGADSSIRLAVRVKGSFVNPALGDTTEIAHWAIARSSSWGVAAAGGDSTAYRQGIPTSVAQDDGFEFVVEIREPNGGSNYKWGAETARWIALADNRGLWWWAPYTAVTIRKLAGAQNGVISVDLIGTAL